MRLELDEAQRREQTARARADHAQRELDEFGRETKRVNRKIEEACALLVEQIDEPTGYTVLLVRRLGELLGDTLG